MKRVLVFDSADGYLFDLDQDMLLSIAATEEINGVNALDISTAQRLEKSYRILVPSATGDWQEYVVINDSATHEAGDRHAYGKYRAVWAIQYDLMTVYGPDVESGGESDVGPTIALQNALNGTSRWAVGNVGTTGAATIEMFGNSAWERVQDVVKVYGGELRQRVTVGFNKVTARYVDLPAHLGSDIPTRRFEWKRDITSISRKASETPLFSRIIPIGKSDDVTIEDVNDGVRWLNDAEADLAYRVPDGHGGWEYPTQKVKFSDIDDDRELLDYSSEHITDYTRPVPTYEASVLQYAAAGMDYTGVALGDVVQIDDYGFNENVPLKLEGRVHKIVRNLMDETDVTLTIGDVGESFSLSLQRMDKTISAVKNSLGVTFGGSLTSTGQYVEWLTGQMNNYINALGGWTYIVPGRGIVTYSVEVSDPNEGAEAKAAVATGNGSVTEIRGGSIRIANSLTQSGDWDWKTVFVSGHIASELVTAAQITTGFIGSAVSGNYWNLDTGEFRMASTSTLGGRTVQQVLDEVDATITSVDVEYAENQSATVPPAESSSAWSTTAPSWREGYYIWQRTATTTGSATTHSDPVMISGRDGKGISTVTVEYGVSSSASTPPSSWSETAPTILVGGDWLWTKTYTTYTDGTDKTSYSKSYTGTNGQSATTYWLDVYPTTIVRNGSTYSPSQLSLNAYKREGDGPATPIKARFTVSRMTGEQGNSMYTSSTDEYGPTISLSSVQSSNDNIQVNLYAAGGFTTQLDQQRIPIIGNGNGIASTSFTYGVSSSASQEPSSYSSTMPAVTQGSWLWTKTRITYTDGSYKDTITKSYAGTDGTSVTILGSYNTLAELQAAHPTGSLGDAYIVSGDLYVWTGSAWSNVGQIQGPAGSSVTVSAIEYAETDGGTPSASEWSTTFPSSVDQGDWLWVRTTYSDGSEAVSKTYIGTDGSDGKSVIVSDVTKVGDTTTVTLQTLEGGAVVDEDTLTIVDGQDGPSGTAGKNGYVHTAWANSANGQTDFSTSVSANKKYLGTYTDNTEADSQVPSKYSWSLIKGADGGDAYTVTLSNESHTFAGGTSAAIASTTRCNVIAYKGTTQVAATIGTILNKPTGMTTTIYNNGTTTAYFNVSVTTSLTTRQGMLTVPITVDGKSFTCTFSWSLALRGEDGVTISRTEYGTSDSSSTQPSSWSQTVPSTVAKGKWLWVKTTYSDGSAATSKNYVGTDGSDGQSVYVTDVTKVGKVTTITITDGTSTQTIEVVDGNDGANGTAGANGLSGYVHTAWANSADGSLDFSTSVSENKLYLGVYTDNVVSDSTNYRDYSWSLIKGDDGLSITEVTEQYFLSSSSTTAPSRYADWQDTQPTWTSGKYIWTRSKILWEDDTVTYTDPVLAQALTQANAEAKSASTAVTNLNTSLNQQEIFNRLTNNGQTQGLYLQNSKLYVNASYINSGALTVSSGSTEIFRADVYNGTLSINTTNFKVTTDGVITATAGKMGGFEIESNRITNDQMRLDSNGVTFGEWSGSGSLQVFNEVGTIGRSRLQLEPSKRGLVFNLDDDAAFMSWGVWDSGMSSYDVKLAYANKTLRMNSGTWSDETLHIGCSTNFHGWPAHNLWIDPDTGGAFGGYSGTMYLTNRSGGYATLVFKNGLLV